MLLVAVGTEMTKASCLQNSFSAYYYTPVRAVFGGALVAIGLSLIVIKGRGLEDLFLNVAGFLAPVVAFVPTVNEGDCYSIEPIPLPVVDGELALWVKTIVSNNMFALLVAGVIAWVVAAVMLYRSNDRGEQDSPSLGINLVGLAVLGGLLVYGFRLFPPGELPDFATVDVLHDWAAILMFVFLAAAAVTAGFHNWAKDSKPADWLKRERRFARAYWVIATLMVLAAILFCLPSEQRVLFVEATELSLFTVYWVLQTWDHSKEPPPPTNAQSERGLVGGPPSA